MHNSLIEFSVGQKLLNCYPITHLYKFSESNTHIFKADACGIIICCLINSQFLPSRCSQMFTTISDVVGFTLMCSHITPMQVVSMLNTMYTLFDAVSEKHHVFKVDADGFPL